MVIIFILFSIFYFLFKKKTCKQNICFPKYFLQNGDFSLLILKLGYMKFKNPWTKYGDFNLFSSSKYGEFGPFEKRKRKSLSRTPSFFKTSNCAKKLIN